MKRPILHRIWFWKPQWYWRGWKTLVPFFRGGDEYDWHTIGFGWTVTGRVIIATRPCPETGKCACEHEWSERGSGDLAWRECWLCGKQTPYETRATPKN